MGDKLPTLDDAVQDGNRKNPSKNPKGSARGKYNRRKVWLNHALGQLEIAIDDVLAQKGTVYKRDEMDTFKIAIREFRMKTGLAEPVFEMPTPRRARPFRPGT